MFTFRNGDVEEMEFSNHDFRPLRASTKHRKEDLILYSLDHPIAKKLQDEDYSTPYLTNASVGPPSFFEDCNEDDTTNLVT